MTITENNNNKTNNVTRRSLLKKCSLLVCIEDDKLSMSCYEFLVFIIWNKNQKLSLKRNKHVNINEIYFLILKLKILITVIPESVTN